MHAANGCSAQPGLRNLNSHGRQRCTRPIDASLNVSVDALTEARLGGQTKTAQSSRACSLAPQVLLKQELVVQDSSEIGSRTMLQTLGSS